MKKFIAYGIMVAILCAGTLTAFSQDTTCVKTEQLRKAAILIEEGKVYKLEAEQLRGQNIKLVDLLNVNSQRLQNFETQVRNYEGQLLLKDETIKSLNKSLKGQKAKTVVVGGAAIVLAVGLILLK